jgi:uncharacterized protein YjlB
MLAHMKVDAPVLAIRLAPSGPIPNHRRWPLLVYNGAVTLSGSDPAAIFEALFARNRWPSAWRNGVYPFHHYHPDGHEALGIYSGEVTVQFGGDAGVTLTARPGDVLVLPAGTGHKKLSSRGSLGVVGAYPEGTCPDTSRKAFSREVLSTIAAVPLPACDPVFGPQGPLFEHWK